jgi:membrane-bound lytic murein transglycosylase A
MQGRPGGFCWRVILMLLVVTTGLAACARSGDTGARPDALALKPLEFIDLPGWRKGHQAGALVALRRSCAKSVKASRPSQWPNDVLPADTTKLCAAAQALGPLDDTDAKNDQARAFFQTWFQAYRAANHDKTDGLFTGYFEAELKGSRTPHPDYPTALYGMPTDHVRVDLADFSDKPDPALKFQRIIGRVDKGKLKPYFDRAAIDAGALAGQELFWVSDPIDAFILHVQGSGRIVLPDGLVARVGFAGHNGHAYRSIGRTLIVRGDLKPGQASWPDIRAWIDDNPDKARALLAVNRRYIFFRERPKGKGGADEGPYGAQGVPLTPERSLAVDRRFIPLGTPIWLDTTWPATEKPLRRLMIAQDTGSAIRGPVRGDFFWGYGAKALAQAGRMKSRGVYYILIPRAQPRAQPRATGETS